MTLDLDWIHASADVSKADAGKCIKAYVAVLASGEYKLHDAKRAYRAAMPLMTDRQSIHSFIVCVAQGTLLDVFDGTEASKLLYVAQVGLSATGHDETEA
jgi:hypothetical protein